MIKIHTIALTALLSLSACSFVDLTEQGKKVRVLEAHEVEKCTYVGKTNASVTEKIAGVRRHDHIIQEELLTVARNAAVNLDGDTVVAEGEESEGRQSFKIYRCVPR